MSQVISEVIGVIELELDADRMETWMNLEEETLIPTTSRLRQDSLPATTEVLLADVTQLSDDLRFETTRMLQRLLKLR